MKTKLITLFILTAIFLNACTLRVCTGKVYACVDYRKGSAEPIVIISNPLREIVRR